MRIWDLSPSLLCRSHLLGEHRELHAIWSILTKGKKGYSLHPETQRWRGKLKALYRRHTALVNEFKRRNYKHHSNLDNQKATGSGRQTVFVDDPEQQKRILIAKGCTCQV